MGGRGERGWEGVECHAYTNPWAAYTNQTSHHKEARPKTALRPLVLICTLVSPRLHMRVCVVVIIKIMIIIIIMIMITTTTAIIIVITYFILKRIKDMA